MSGHFIFLMYSIKKIIEMNKPYVFVENGRTPEYRAKLELIDSLGIDPFAREYISDPRFDAKEVIMETEHWYVFANQHKYTSTKHQFVFVSQEEVETLWELSPTAHTDLVNLIKKMCEENNIIGGGIVSRFGPGHKSGATVKHLHVQLMEPEDGNKIAAWFGHEKEK